jgi:RNA polymerase sigma-B factor
MKFDIDTKDNLLSLLLEYNLTRAVTIRNKIVVMNAGLVKKVAYKISLFCSESYEDIEQVAFIGLISAIERFDPKLNNSFSSYAVPSIRGEILHFLRDRGDKTIKIPRRLQDLYYKSRKVVKDLTSITGLPPNNAEIADALEISVSDWEECQLAMECSKCLSLDAFSSYHSDSGHSLAECLADKASLDQAINDIEFDALSRAIFALPQPTRDAVGYVYIDGLRRKEAATKMGVSPMTVTRHIEIGIARISVLLNDRGSI